jgi:hypothetical protein
VMINQSFSVKCVVDSTKNLSEVRVDQSVVFCEVCCRFCKAPE